MKYLKLYNYSHYFLTRTEIPKKSRVFILGAADVKRYGQQSRFDVELTTQKKILLLLLEDLNKFYKNLPLCKRGNKKIKKKLRKNAIF